MPVLFSLSIEVGHMRDKIVKVMIFFEFYCKKLKSK